MAGMNDYWNQQVRDAYEQIMLNGGQLAPNQQPPNSVQVPHSMSPAVRRMQNNEDTFNRMIMEDLNDHDAQMRQMYGQGSPMTVSMADLIEQAYLARAARWGR